MYLNNNKLKQGVFLIALIALGVLLFWLLKGFVSGFLGSVVFYILLRRPYFFLTEQARYKWNKSLAAMALMLLSFIVLILPLFLVSVMLSGKVNYLVHHYEEMLHLGQQWSNNASAYLGVDLLSDGTIGKLTGVAAGAIPKFLSATADALFGIFVTYLLLYFMLVNARGLERQVRLYLPFTEGNDRLLLTELRRQTVSNSIGIAVLAILQGLVAWVGYWLFGVDEPGFWAIITAITSVIPVVGTAIVWIPLSIFLYASGHHWQGFALLAYCGVVLSSVDNIFRFVALKKMGDVHPLITFFGVVIGLDLFGFVGVIFGPLLISYFILLLKIYRNEYFGVPHETPT